MGSGRLCAPTDEELAAVGLSGLLVDEDNEVAENELFLLTGFEASTSGLLSTNLTSFDSKCSPKTSS